MKNIFDSLNWWIGKDVNRKYFSFKYAAFFTVITPYNAMKKIWRVSNLWLNIYIYIYIYIYILKVEGHLRVCGNGEFRIFPLLQMRSQDTNLSRSYETRFQRKFKTKLNKLWWETYARKLHKKPSIVKQLIIACITFKTDVAKLQSN